MIAVKTRIQAVFGGIQTASTPAVTRLLALDALRGFIIVLMALDHANSFIAHGQLQPELWADLFPNYGTDTLRFLTRFITHLAAPGFFFLMGTGMALWAASRTGPSWTPSRIARHFIVRGLLLIALQLTLENLAWSLKGDPFDGATYFGVLYALGATMILGTPLLALPTRVLVAVSALMIALVELSLPEARSGFVAYPPLLRLWLLPGGYDGSIFVLYPVFPCLGVVGLGMAYGRWLRRDPTGAYRGALWAGVSALLAFLWFRALGTYGNIRPPQNASALAFFNLVKYPPAVAFLTLTLGIDLVLLWLLARRFTGRFANRQESAPKWLLPLVIIGRVPLFFYLAHLYLYGVLGLLLKPYTISIPGMIPFWLLGLVVLLPLCALYGRFKHTRPPDSLWRLL